LVAISGANAALNTPEIDGMTFTATNGGQWVADFLGPGASDPFGNILEGGGWAFDLTNGAALPALDLTSASPPDFLSTFVETVYPLERYDLYQHITLDPISGFGDLWNMQTIGLGEILYGDQEYAFGVVPEPSTSVMFLIAGAWIGLLRTRVRRIRETSDLYV
jgi:hypothetical protein